MEKIKEQLELAKQKLSEAETMLIRYTGKDDGVMEDLRRYIEYRQGYKQALELTINLLNK